jgi:mannitol-1-phosphate/altronate dehydrogenase
MRPRAVIIGAGALGLGFVAERLAPDYDLCFADLRAQEERLRRLERQGSYTVNLCSLDGVTARQVRGNMGIAFTDRPEEEAVLRREVEQADLILTATSRRLLDQIVPWLSEILNARQTRHYL